MEQVALQHRICEAADSETKAPQNPQIMYGVMEDNLSASTEYSSGEIDSLLINTNEVRFIVDGEGDGFGGLVGAFGVAANRLARCSPK